MSTLSVLKVRAYLSAAVLGIAALASTPYAQAQVKVVKVNIPFGFETGSEHLPAGPYTIIMESQSIMRVQGPSKGTLSMALPQESLRTAPASKVVFHRYGDRYFLREVWVAGSSSHLQTPKSRSEKRLQVARNDAPPTGDEVALLEMPR